MSEKVRERLNKLGKKRKLLKIELSELDCQRGEKLKEWTGIIQEMIELKKELKGV